MNYETPETQIFKKFQLLEVENWWTSRVFSATSGLKDGNVYSNVYGKIYPYSKLDHVS